MSSINVTVPVKTVNEHNAGRFSWRVRSGLRRKVRKAVSDVMQWYRPPQLPVRVVMTRLSAGVMDMSGLWSALKPVQDEIAGWLGVDDGPRDTRAQWVVRQELCPRRQYGVRIEVESVEGSNGEAGT